VLTLYAVSLNSETLFVRTDYRSARQPLPFRTLDLRYRRSIGQAGKRPVCGADAYRTGIETARRPVASDFSQRGHYTEANGIGVQTIIV